MTSKLQLRREEFGFSALEVSELSDISVDAIRRIESGHNPYRTNITTAQALAHGLDCEVEDLFDLEDLSELGRPARTGKPVTRVVKRPIAEMLCPDCFTLVPADIGCEICGQPALPVV